MSVHNRLPNPKNQPRNPKINRVSPLGAFVAAAYPFSPGTHSLLNYYGDTPVGGEDGKVFDVSGRGQHAVTSDITSKHTPFGTGAYYIGDNIEEFHIYGPGDTGLPMWMESNKAFTITALIKFGDSVTSQIIFQERDEAGEEGWSFQITTMGELEYINHAGADPTELTTEMGLVASGVWHRVGIAIDDHVSEDDPDVAIYYDGVEVAFHVGGGEEINTFLGGDFLAVGKESWSSSSGLIDATIADITVYDKFLSEPEAALDAATLFEGFYRHELFATDFTEPLQGGAILGGSATVQETQAESISGGVLVGGKPDEEPPTMGGAILGGHAAEFHVDITVSGGALIGGVAVEGRFHDAQGGFVAGGVAAVTAVYNILFGTTNITPQAVANTAVQSGVFNEWFNPKLVTMGQDTNSFAKSTLEDSDTAKSNILRATKFKLGIPTGITIDGIEVCINCKTNNAGRGEFDRIFLTKDGTNPVGTEKNDVSEIGNTQHDESYGSGVDLWGTTWSVAELNSDNFGFGVQCIAGAGSGTTQINIYQMWLRVSGVDINNDNVVIVSGLGELTKTFNETVSGGMLAGGAGLESEGQEEPTSGGILAGGLSTIDAIYDIAPSGGILAGGEGLEQISGTTKGGVLAGGHAPELHDDIVTTGGVVMAGGGEVTFFIPKGGTIAGGQAAWSITPAHEGGALMGGLAVTGFASFGGIKIASATTEQVIYAGTVASGGLISGAADFFGTETRTPAGGVLVDSTATRNVIYDPVITGGVVLGGKPDEVPDVSGGVKISPESLSFVEGPTRGGVLLGGEGIEVVGLIGTGGALMGGAITVQVITSRPVSGGFKVGVIAPGADWNIMPGVSGGTISGGTATVTAEYTITVSPGSIVGGRAVAGIEPPASGGMLAGGESFEFITEIGIGGALIGGTGSQAFNEVGVGGSLAGGAAASSINYSGHGGAVLGGSAQRSTSIIEHPAGGAVLGGSAQRSTSIIEHPAGGGTIGGKHLLGYSFIGGVNFDDTVSHGGPITIGGGATVIRPTIKFIGDGPVVVSGTAITSFTFSDFEFISQTPTTSPLAVSGVAVVVLVINDQVCDPPETQSCHIADIQTGQKRTHCPVPELFAPYCGDLRKGNQCNKDTALLPAIIACRQKLLLQQDVLSVKNKTVLRNRGHVI